MLCGSLVPSPFASTLIRYQVEGIPAIMVIASPTAVPIEVQDLLRARDGIVSVYAIDLK